MLQYITHAQEVIDAINSTGAMLIFLPPYSPDFMPCEELFAQTKSYIRQNDIYRMAKLPGSGIDGMGSVSPEYR